MADPRLDDPEFLSNRQRIDRPPCEYPAPIVRDVPAADLDDERLASEKRQRREVVVEVAHGFKVDVELESRGSAPDRIRLNPLRYNGRQRSVVRREHRVYAGCERR